jgi:hypothetical protein
MAAELRGIAGAINGPLGRLLTSLLGDAQVEPQVRSVLIERLFGPRSQASANNISRAQAGGTLRPDVPPRVAIDLLVGPLFYRMFVQHEPVTDTFVKQVLRYVVEGLHPRAIATSRPGRRERQLGEAQYDRRPGTLVGDSVCDEPDPPAAVRGRGPAPTARWPRAHERRRSDQNLTGTYGRSAIGALVPRVNVTARSSSTAVMRPPSSCTTNLQV